MTYLTDSRLDLYNMTERRENSMEAGQQVTLAAAALLEYRAQNGHFPEQLDERFTDPFTGKPLLYRREGTDGCVVYAAVPDETSAAIRLPGSPNPIFRASRRPGRPIYFRYPAPPVPQDMLADETYPFPSTLYPGPAARPTSPLAPLTAPRAPGR